MHVPLIPVAQRTDVSLLLKIVQELISVTPDLAMLQPENVLCHPLFVTTTTHAQLTAATKLLENAYLFQRAAMTKMHVQLTVATEILEFASTPQRYVTTTMSAQRIAAMPNLENASSKIFQTISSLQLQQTNASPLNVMQSSDSYKPQSLAHPLTNVPKHSATQQEDVFFNLLFAVLNLEVLAPNVTQTLEFARLSFLTAMTKTHVPMMLMFQGLDALTLQNVSPQTCA